MTPEDIYTRDSNSNSDIPGLQELPPKVESSDDNSNANMPSFVPRARNRSESSDKEDSGDDSEADEWNLRHVPRITRQQSPPETSPVSSRDFGYSNSDKYSVNSGCEDEIPELAERYNVDGTTWEELDRGPNPTQSQNQTWQRTSKPNTQTYLLFAYNEMPKFGPT